MLSVQACWLQYAGNVLVYGKASACDGDWFGGVNADNAADFLDALLSSKVRKPSGGSRLKGINHGTPETQRMAYGVVLATQGQHLSGLQLCTSTLGSGCMLPCQVSCLSLSEVGLPFWCCRFPGAPTRSCGGCGAGGWG